MRLIYPHVGFLLFTAVVYSALLSGVPAGTLIPATLGVGAFLAMTVCMVLAARIRIVDGLLGGPGRSYQVHRISAHWAWIMTLAHWTLAEPRGESIVPGWEEFGTRAGTFAGIYLMILVLYGLIPAIPYHVWRWTHYAMGPIYLVTVTHVFLSAIPVEDFSVHWWMLAVLSVVGIAAMARVIAHHLHRPRRMQVSVLKNNHDSIDIRLEPRDGKGPVTWCPGQHASLSCTKRGLREPHPFTIASAPNQNGMRFVIFDRGDYTKKLQTQLKIGDEVLLNRIAGDFAPQTDPKRIYRQIWVAGGAGITPFLAALGAMSPDHGPRIDLFYIYRSMNHAVDLHYLAAMAKRLPQLVVHFLGDAEGGRFNMETFDAHLPPGWQSSELFACGPDPLLTIACRSYRAAGGQLPIHTEVFDFRNPIRTWRQVFGLGPKRTIQQRPPSEDAHPIGPKTIGAPAGMQPAWPQRRPQQAPEPGAIPSPVAS